MKTILMINGGQIYAQAKGQFNQNVTEKTAAFFGLKSRNESGRLTCESELIYCPMI